VNDAHVLLAAEVKITEAKGGGVEQGCVLIWSLK
jgi:hypothetical protein